MVFQAPNLKVVVRPRPLRGRLVTGRHPHRSIIFALLLPALMLVTLLLIWPIVVTMSNAFWAEPFWRSPLEFRTFPGDQWTRYFIVAAAIVGAAAILTAVLRAVGRKAKQTEKPDGKAAANPDEKPDSTPDDKPDADEKPGKTWHRQWAKSLHDSTIAVAVVLLVAFLPEIAGSIDAAGRRAFFLTLGWIVLGIGLLLLGAWIAWATRRRRLWLPLVLPTGVSALVSGVVFRLAFDPTPERSWPAGVANWLGSWAMALYQQHWITVVLIFAFAWIWLPFVVSLFRAGIDAIYADPAKRAYLEGPETEPGKTRKWARSRQFWRSILLSRQVVLLIIVTISVAAARVFDLILIAVPWSMQYDVDTAGVHWWRLVESGRDPGRTAAFAVLLGLLVGIIAWRVQLGIKHHQHGIGRPARPRPPELETGRKQRPGVLTLLAFGGTVLWLAPFGVLLATAFHTPADAARAGWTMFSQFSFDSFARVLDIAQLWDSFATTAWVAVLATVSVLVLASPVAYILAALSPRSLRSRAAVAVLVVLAVMPVQLYIEQLRDFFGDERLAGTRVPLILVHVAAGLPFAVLVLRGALLAPEDSPASDSLYGLTSRGTTLRRIWRKTGPALAAVAVLELVLVWNDFIISFLLSGSGASPLSLLLWGEARQLAVSSGTVAAGAVLASIPPVVLIMLTWRRLVVPGLTGGVLR